MALPGVADSVRRVPGSEACPDCRENPLSLVTQDSPKAKHSFKFDSRLPRHAAQKTPSR